MNTPTPLAPTPQLATRSSRRGFALPAAILTILVVGVLVTGGFFMAQQEQKIGMASSNAQRALYLAERGVSEVIENWKSGNFTSLGTFASSTVTDTTSEGIWTVEVTKTSDWTYFLDGRSRITVGGRMAGASRRVGMVAKMRTALINPPAALTTVGSLKLGGSSEVYGQDSIPTGWGGGICDPADMANKPGVMIDDDANVETSGSTYVLSGDPPIAEDSTIVASSLLQFGDVSWEDLVALADIRISSGTTVTGTAPDSTTVDGSWVCNTANTNNWGEPLQPGSVCGNYFPIIYGQGNLKINSNGFGQGILLIEGDLNLQGGFTFYGPVIVKGTLSTAGTGGHFNGGVIAANVNLETTTVLGNALVQYSSCAVERAILNSGVTRAEPLVARSWVDLSSLGGQH